MQPLLIHYCCACTYNTPVPFSASVFSQNHTCNHCGTVSVGINARGKEEEKADMQQEELSRLFSNSLTLSHSPPPPPESKVEQPQQQNQEQTISKQPQSQPITYISQHYTHSSHVVPKAQSAPVSTYIGTSELEAIFLRNSIDPTLLFPSQIILFQNADNDQRLRLLELWRISPPSYGGHALARELYDWPPTSLQQEETMAKLRYERMMEKERQETNNIVVAEIHNHNQAMDESMDHEFAAVRAVPTLLSPSPEENRQNAEPYILSGYEALAKREYDQQAGLQEQRLQESTRYNQAVDPVYKVTAGMWEKSGLQDMENQYGAFAQMREYGVSPPQHSFVSYGDDDMVM